MTNLSTRIPPVTEAVAVTNDHLREDATLKNKCETISESDYHNVINLSEHYTILVWYDVLQTKEGCGHGFTCVTNCDDPISGKFWIKNASYSRHKVETRARHKSTLWSKSLHDNTSYSRHAWYKSISRMIRRMVHIKPELNWERLVHKRTRTVQYASLSGQAYMSEGRWFDQTTFLSTFQQQNKHGLDIPRECMYSHF